MKSLISILFILLALSVNAQKIRFTNSTNQWTSLMINGDGCTAMISYSYVTDTIVNGVSYKRLQGLVSMYYSYHDECTCGGPGGSSTYCVREDTVAGRVYYLNIASDTVEHILYDYNLNVGDSISYIVSSGSYTDTIASIDSALYNGIYYKIFNMQNKQFGNQRSYTVLEGIGCTNDPVFPTYFGTCFEYGESLVCFYENGVRPAISAPINSCSMFSTSCYSGFSFDNIIGCDMFLSTVDPEKQPATVTISPNPAYDYIDITTNRPFDDNTTISVYDINGSCILKTKANGQKDKVEINTFYWSDGLYMVIVQDNTGIIKKEKVVVMK